MKMRGLTSPDLSTSSAYDYFKQKYYPDPQGFVRDCIRWNRQKDEHATTYQIDALQQLYDSKRLALRGPHGLGKTAICAWLVLWFSLTRDGKDWKVITTAGAWRQLTKYLWPEIGKWSRKLYWKRIGRPAFDTRRELLNMNIKLETGQAFAVASDNHAYIEGAHADHLLYIFDESKSIQDAMFDAAEGAFSTAGTQGTEALALSVSTPGEPAGRFFAIHNKEKGYEDWRVLHVTQQMATDAGRMTQEWVEQRRRQWGETSAIFKNRVQGDFASGEKDGVIPMVWVEAAHERWYEWEAAGFPGVLTSVGVDVGGGMEESDRTVFAACYDYIKIKQLHEFVVGDPGQGTMEVADALSNILDTSRSALAIVDVIGIGAGVAHRLRQLNRPVGMFNAAYTTELKDRTGELGFLNWRAAMWYITREMLDPNSGFAVCLPPDDDLDAELTRPLWTVNGKNQVQVESKETIRRRLKRSTDKADAVLQALVGPLLLDELAAHEGRTRISYEPLQIGDW